MYPRSVIPGKSRIIGNALFITGTYAAQITTFSGVKRMDLLRVERRDATLRIEQIDE